MKGWPDHGPRITRRIIRLREYFIPGPTFMGSRMRSKQSESDLLNTPTCRFRSVCRRVQDKLSGLEFQEGDEPPHGVKAQVDMLIKQVGQQWLRSSTRVSVVSMWFDRQGRNTKRVFGRARGPEVIQARYSATEIL